VSRQAPASRRVLVSFGSAHAATVQAAAVPYGFTLTFGASLALAVRGHGPPSLLDALLLVCGAVAGFTVLALAVAKASAVSVARVSAAATVLVVGPVTAGCAAATVCASWAAGRLVGGPAAWATAGCAVTLVYFGLTSLTRALLASRV
jgi:hypothetical protein